jgi:hypothetical protein
LIYGINKKCQSGKNKEENINIIFLLCPSERGRNVNAIKCKTGRITYCCSSFKKQATEAVNIIKIKDRAKYILYLIIENTFELKQKTAISPTTSSA